MTFEDAKSKLDMDKIRRGREDLHKAIKSFSILQLTESRQFISSRVKYDEQSQILDRFTIEKLSDVDNWTDQDFEDYSTLLLTI